MKKIFYLLFSSVVILACQSEEKKSGEVVHVDEEKETNPTDSNFSIENDKVITIDEKDEINLKGGGKIGFIKRGSGKKVKKGSMVSVNYKTFLPNGKLIDGSDILGRPLPYYVGINMSIKGWDEAFQYLSVGDKIKLHLPSEKAYGKKGYGTMVPPNTDLDFEIEIVEEIKAEKTASGLEIYILVDASKNKQAKEGQMVDIHYYAWLFEEGKLYDSSHFNGKPHRFKVGAGEEILAWEEIVKLMHKGDKYLVVVPSELGYAEKGVPELVPPNSKLVFVIEMMNII